MRSIFTYLGVICLVFFSFKSLDNTKEITLAHEPLIEGEWDNFQQYWLENTAEDKHRVETDDKHRHFSLRVNKEEKGVSLELLEGRNGKNFIKKIMLSKADFDKGHYKIDGDTLFVTGVAPFINKDPYKFIKVRKFSGWIEYPMESEPNGVYHQGNLEIHDQGGMAELDIDGVDYTVELTQLLFAKKISYYEIGNL